MPDFRQKLKELDPVNLTFAKSFSMFNFSALHETWCYSRSFLLESLSFFFVVNEEIMFAIKFIFKCSINSRTPGA